MLRLTAPRRRVLLCMAILALVLCSELVDAKKKKKKKVEQKTDSSEAEEDEGSKKRSKKWSEYTAEDWRRLEDEYNELEDDEEMERERRKPKPFDPENPNEFLKNARAGQDLMTHQYLINKDGWTQDETDDLAKKYRALLMTASVDAAPYVIGPGHILWRMDGSKLFDVQNFVMRQEETDFFQVDQQKTYRSEWLKHQEL